MAFEKVFNPETGRTDFIPVFSSDTPPTDTAPVEVTSAPLPPGASGDPFANTQVSYLRPETLAKINLEPVTTAAPINEDEKAAQWVFWQAAKRAGTFFPSPLEPGFFGIWEAFKNVRNYFGGDSGAGIAADVAEIQDNTANKDGLDVTDIGAWLRSMIEPKSDPTGQTIFPPVNTTKIGETIREGITNQSTTIIERIIEKEIEPDSKAWFGWDDKILIGLGLVAAILFLGNRK